MRMEFITLNPIDKAPLVGSETPIEPESWLALPIFSLAGLAGASMPDGDGDIDVDSLFEIAPPPVREVMCVSITPANLTCLLVLECLRLSSMHLAA